MVACNTNWMIGTLLPTAVRRIKYQPRHLMCIQGFHKFQIFLSRCPLSETISERLGLDVNIRVGVERERKVVSHSRIGVHLLLC